MILRTQTIRFTEDRKPRPKKLQIGYETDNMVERVRFELPTVAENQTATLMLDGEYANMILLTADGDGVYSADLTAERVGMAGEAEAYITINGDGGEVWNSGVFLLVTGDLPNIDGDIAERFPDAIEQMRGEIAEHRAEMEGQTEAVEALVTRAGTAAAAAQESADTAQRISDSVADIRDQWESAGISVEMLPANAEATAEIAQQQRTIEFRLGIPRGDVALASFEVDGGMNLIMNTPEGYGGVDFALNDDMCLEVII